MPIDFDADQISVLDELVDIHKKRWRRRARVGESLRYVREAADQQGLGEEFFKLWVHNDSPRNNDPADPMTDLSLLQIYEHWRAHAGMRPIQPWDGRSLRPWLPSTDNPQIPSSLSGDLGGFRNAYTHFNPEYEQFWRRLDALGNAVEGYFHQIRQHQVWSRPDERVPLRLYYLNELNNIETAPYSIRFWGFLKWAEKLRRKLFDLPDDEYPHDEFSDIEFLDEFNQHHFPWHDDVFGLGTCPRIDDQFGQRRRYIYPMGSQGYGYEFMLFHRDLLESHRQWRQRLGYPDIPTWHPGRNHSSYILKYAFGGPWGLGGTNGQVLDAKDVAPELLDPDLSSFQTVAELGVYLDSCGIRYHGTGHVQDCDIRDVYTNNYSIRFFGWHQWIDDLVTQLLDQGKPWYDNTLPLDRPPRNNSVSTFCATFSPPKPPREVFSGVFSFGAEKYSASGDEWLCGELLLQQTAEPQESPNRVGLVGQLLLESGVVLDVKGYIDQDNLSYQTTPEWYDERLILVLASPKDAAQRLELFGHFHVPWPDGPQDVVAFSGAARLAGETGTFSALKDPDKAVYFQSGTFSVPAGVTTLNVQVWGGGGGGGSDGPGVGGSDGEQGTDSRIGDLVAHGGKGGTHGVNQQGLGGAGGSSSGTGNCADGENGDDANSEPGLSGRGGNAAGPHAGTGGRGVGVNSDGEHGQASGGGGSGAQEGHSPGGGGGGGGFIHGEVEVESGATIDIVVATGGAGGNAGERAGGNGAGGRVLLSWKKKGEG